MCVCSVCDHSDSFLHPERIVWVSTSLPLHPHRRRPQSQRNQVRNMILHADSDTHTCLHIHTHTHKHMNLTLIFAHTERHRPILRHHPRRSRSRRPSPSSRMMTTMYVVSPIVCCSLLWCGVVYVLACMFVVCLMCVCVCVYRRDFPTHTHTLTHTVPYSTQAAPAGPIPKGGPASKKRMLAALASQFEKEQKARDDRKVYTQTQRQHF